MAKEEMNALGFVELTDEELQNVVGGFDNPYNCSWMHGGKPSSALTNLINGFIKGFKSTQPPQ